jgi:hypothetical protein
MGVLVSMIPSVYSQIYVTLLSLMKKGFMTKHLNFIYEP